VTFEDRLYPKAWGHPALRTALAEYYNSNYGTNIVPENVMVHRAPLTYRSTPNPMPL
jgi:aspartate/methionine/tyrosine aminotransferase